MLRHLSKHKSIDHAIALNFQHRCEDKEYGVIQSEEKDYLVVPTNHPTFAGEDFEQLLDSYASLDYERTESIYIDRIPFYIGNLSKECFLLQMERCFALFWHLTYH